MSRAAWILTGAFVLLLATLAAEAASKGTVEHAQPGTLVKLQTGRKLHIRCVGTGSPTVVLTAGAGEHSLTWQSLQKQLARTARVCAWDRAGFGRSDPSPEVQDIAHTTDDLEAVLAGSNTRPPYVLVGHSLGGFETLLLAFRHSHDVVGIVLIDPASPYQGRRLSQAAPAAFAVIDTLQQEQIADMKAHPSGNVQATANAVSLLDNAFSEKDSQEIRASWHSLGSIALLVLTAGELPPLPFDAAGQAQIPQLKAEWSRMHDETASLSTRGANRTVPGATHYIYLEREGVVLDAIQEVLAAARTKP